MNLTIKQLMQQYTVRELRAKLNRRNHYTVRDISKRVWALRVWKEQNPEATLQQEVEQLRSAK